MKTKLTRAGSTRVTKNDDAPKMPHERDETPSDQPIKPQKKMQQASKDLQDGQVDTDMHGQRGVEEVVKNTGSPSPKP